MAAIEECVLRAVAAGAVRVDEVREGLEAVGKASETLTTWALAVVVASVAAIVGTSYLRPQKLRIRLMYLLFVPGWGLLAVSIYFGDEISRRILALLMFKKERTFCISDLINDAFANQILFFELSLICAGLWLLAYLLWWIFTKEKLKGE